MSTRTIIEINHDELNRLLEDQSDFVALLKAIRGTAIVGRLNKGEHPYFGSGLYVLCQCHHKDSLKFKA